MRGLDPRIHDEGQRRKTYGLLLSRIIMDGRVKPGHDSRESAAFPSQMAGTSPAMTEERVEHNFFAGVLQQRQRRLCAGLAAALALSLLTGCGSFPILSNSSYSGPGNGDFGRVKPSLTGDDTHAWLGGAAARKVSDPPWRHQLTDEERQLRDYAFPLIDPPYNRQRWFSVMAEHGFWHRPWPYPDRGAYASRMFQTPYRSQNARYAKLIEDMRNDVTRLESFTVTARHIADMDKKREQSLAYVTGLTAEERDNTINRIRENDGIIRWVHASLQERAG
jgi:hypothetical protein